jgi:hypothetical protein
MQFTTIGLIGKRAKERRALRRERRQKRKELKSDRKNRKISATTKAERRDMRQSRKNDRLANRHEFRMSDNFKVAAQARGQVATNAIQAGSNLVSSFTGRGGGFAPIDNSFTPASASSINNDFNSPSVPAQRGIFGERPLIQGVPDIAVIGGAALILFTLSSSHSQKD